MPLDPQIKALLDKGAALPPWPTIPVAEARAQAEARSRALAPPLAVDKVTDLTMAGPGGPLKLRVYTPVATAADKAPFPLIVFFHGGGFVLCSLETHDAMCRNLSAGAGAVVVSVDYRLAPEVKFPHATDDCLFATRWAAEHATDLNIDISRIVVAGDSAGGTLATVTALRLRDEGGPRLCGQVLLYPATEHYTAETLSMNENGVGYGLTRATMEWFWNHYLAGPEHTTHPHAAPLRADTLQGLPPTLVVTAEFDPLRDEGELYARALQAAGVPVILTRWSGMNHAFLFWVGVVDKAGQAINEIYDWLRQRFGTSTAKSRS